MCRLARVVAPGYPHHITQRGNRRQKVFFNEGDYRLYLDLLRTWCAKYSVDIWTYCLMPNHVHLVAVPGDKVGLRLAIGETHRRYTYHINQREGWKGHLWQERFSSFVMDNNYLLAATRYIELNPVRAGLANEPCSYAWSSAFAHMRGGGDSVARFTKLDEIAGGWKNFIRVPCGAAEILKLKAHSGTGRPLGGEEFISDLERVVGRVLSKRKRGPRPKRVESAVPLISVS